MISLRLLAFVLAWMFVGPATAEEPMRLPVDAEPIVFETTNGQVKFEIEVADEPAERSQGLMHRTDLPQNRGMLFVNEGERRISMWMANTPAPLDMVFINGQGKVVALEKETTPFSPATIAPDVPARYVLELNAGIADKNAIEVGSHARHRLIGAR